MSLLNKKGMRVYWAFTEYPLVTPSTHPFHEALNDS
jgi:hypothetical protein